MLNYLNDGHYCSVQYQNPRLATSRTTHVPQTIRYPWTAKTRYRVCLQGCSFRSIVVRNMGQIRSDPKVRQVSLCADNCRYQFVELYSLRGLSANRKKIPCQRGVLLAPRVIFVIFAIHMCIMVHKIFTTSLLMRDILEPRFNQVQDVNGAICKC